MGPPTNPPTKQFQPVSPYNANDLDFSLTVAIANAGQTSGAADLGSKTLVGFRLPTFTGTTITFLASYDGGTTYEPLWYGGAAYSVTVAGTVYVTVDPAVFAGVRYLKLVSGSAEGGARTITLVTRPI